MLSLHQSPFDIFEILDQQMSSAQHVPTAEVVEANDAYIVRVELPGVSRDSIDIKATEHNLVINAVRKTRAQEAETLMSEFRSGTWARNFRFAKLLNRDQLKASYRDGILEIVAGKAIQHTSVTVKVED